MVDSSFFSPSDICESYDKKTNTILNFTQQQMFQSWGLGGGGGQVDIPLLRAGIKIYFVYGVWNFVMVTNEYPTFCWKTKLFAI